MAEDEAWGHLLSTTHTKSPVRLGKKAIKIGRKNDCDISFVANKLISGNHCNICRDDDGKTWLTDTSTNGTFLNGRKIKIGEKVQIKHNDQIHLVHRKNQPDDDVAYIFQDLKTLKEEFNLLDNTQGYDIENESGATETDQEQVNKAKRSLEESEGEMQPDAKKPKEDTDSANQQENIAHKNQKSPKRDTMGETLLCGICQDIFHDCLSLQPCLHSFCSSCYSQWMQRSKECPNCRLPVERMNRNHMVNNLVEAYLTQNPEKRRDTEELAEMDARNKITADMIQPKTKTRREYYEDYDENDESFGEYLDTSDDEIEDYEHEESAEEDEINYNIGLARMPSTFGSLFGFTSSSFRPPPTVCRWCPTSRRTGASCGAIAQTSTTDIAPGVPQPVCPDRMVHLMCLCCMQPMPKHEDLPQPLAGFTYAKSQRCGICSNFYCHLLWKCNKPGCRGCLNEFKDLDFDNNCLDGLIMNNKYESQILKNYLSDKGWAIKELLQKCLEKLDNKQYTTPDCISKPEMGSKYVLCYRCGLKNFKDLAYQFRRDVPNEDLPAAVTSRSDCHWGKNCRTQTNPSNPHHASRYNHICEQTRFS